MNCINIKHQTLRNRGKEGRDDLLFGTEKMRTRIIEACTDMHYLLSRGFAEKSSVQLVGNRYRLNARQQQVLQGMSASQEQINLRIKTNVDALSLKGETIIIDGFNLLIILESALSGAYVFKGLDGCFRDIAGVHGTYKRVNQTLDVLKMIGDYLKRQEVDKVIWILDKPVSNSGRLKGILYEIADEQGYRWDVFLENNPDKIVAESKHIGVSSDAWVLDRLERWFNLAGVLIESFKPQEEIVFSKRN